MESCGHEVSLESLTREILRAKRHEGGLKMWPVLSVDAEWFAQIREEIARLVERRAASDLARPDHPTNWVGIVGRATQHSLFNPTGDTSGYGSDHDGLPQGKFFADSNSPATARLVALLSERLTNFRLSSLFPGAGLQPHEEPIVRDREVCLRFHLPVFTNQRASIVLDGERFHFEPGVIYFFNKGCVHAAENLGDSPRRHLLWDLWLDPWVFDNLFGPGGQTPGPGLRRLEHARAAELCASTPVEIARYTQGTASGAILRAERREGRGAFEKRPVNFNPDIVPSDESIALSGPWHPLEHFEGDTFRWVSGSADFTLHALEDGMEDVQLEVEPGPGVADPPMQLEVVDRDGCQLLTGQVQGRRPLKLRMPVHAGSANRFRILARNGGRQVPGDARALDFRIFRVERGAQR